MSKVHINFDNDVRPCDAETIDDCPYGKDLGSINHFDNPADAYLEQAKRYTEKHGLFTALQKPIEYSNVQSGIWHNNAVSIHPKYCGCFNCSTGQSVSINNLDSEVASLILEDLQKGRKVFYHYSMPDYEISYYSENLKRPVLEYQEYEKNFIYREYETDDENNDNVFAVHTDENGGRSGYDTLDKRAGWSLQKDVWIDDAIAFDPPDCGCTDCLVGNSMPINYRYSGDDFEQFHRSAQEGRPILYRGSVDENEALVFDEYSKTYEFRELKEYETIDMVNIFPIKE